MGRDIDSVVLAAHTQAAIRLAIAECVDNALTTARNLPEPWINLSEEQQEQITDEAEGRARITIDDLLSAIGSGGFQRIPAMLESFNQGKTNVAKLIVPDSADRDSRHALGDAKGTPVTIVLTPHSTFEPTKRRDPDDTQGDLLAGVAASMEAQDAEGEDSDGDSEPEE